MVGSIFQTLGEVISGYVDAISSMFSSLMDIFYQTEGGLTLMGTLLLIGLGIGCVKWAFNLIKGLIRL